MKWFMRSDKGPGKAHVFRPWTGAGEMIALCASAMFSPNGARGWGRNSDQWREVQPGESWCAGRCKRCEKAAQKRGEP